MNLESFEKFHVALQSPLLLISVRKGVMGCGYFNIETFNRTGEAAVIVRGVNTHEDMLTAKVVAVSDAARSLGIEPGMTGAAALQKLS
ncbi:MAG: YunC family protein [Verrucomicrobiota bacterium]